MGRKAKSSSRQKKDGKANKEEADVDVDGIADQIDESKPSVERDSTIQSREQQEEGNVALARSLASEEGNTRSAPTFNEKDSTLQSREGEDEAFARQSVAEQDAEYAQQSKRRRGRPKASETKATPRPTAAKRTRRKSTKAKSLEEDTVEFDDDVKASAPAPASSPPTRRSGRARTTTKRSYNEDDEDDEDELVVDDSESTPVKPSKFPASAPSTAKKRRGKAIVNMDTTHLLTSDKSRLLDVDLHDIINQEMWDILTPDQKAECLALVPDLDRVYPQDTDTDPPEKYLSKADLIPSFFQRNQFLREAIADFVACLESDAYGNEALKTALATNEQRKQGKFDAWKDQEFERYWGQKQRLDSYAVAGDARGVSFADVVKASGACVGDVWVYHRSFGKGKGRAAIPVRKEIHLMAIDPQTSALTFSVPAGVLELLTPDGPALTVENIISATGLETVILDIDSRTTKQTRPNGNAWKRFRVRRRNQDLGSLFEIRQRVWGGLQE
ncbi:hypothetical protein SAICODRAFT_8432 [Saitoella complicata NRRL Y-17804]|uniref:uncharacterized protein n=1 Tax=Saitoella complicata (strain BCRC 22490 / CBS 7301 / JCM 7358 / NBRC 10748 / NRRL Y-17804) TaxID=698492 RepID=UPI000866B164|nr:uncharacterized protein SAICODRAFT_8432 [Saitoella complicata NRRL Y-17804]ODQ51843.1 hypothetical protein SAICODRAFT_8432 [Saitoella complicata NRRL Y-17804]